MPTFVATVQLRVLLNSNKFSRHKCVVYFFLFFLFFSFTEIIIGNKPQQITTIKNKPTFIKNDSFFNKFYQKFYRFTGAFFNVIIQLNPVRAHLYVLSERCAKSEIDLRRFLYQIQKNRCCSTDIKINTTYLRIDVVAQI